MGKQIANSNAVVDGSVLKKILQSHEAVCGVFVTPSCNSAQLNIYVTPKWDAAAGGPGNEFIRLLSEQVQLWERVFDHGYLQSSQIADPKLNFWIWKSRYTGQALPTETMLEWLQTTVRRIASLEPKSILEIGCGSGLLLFSLLEQTAEYVGTDISEAGLSYVRDQLSKLNGTDTSVEVFRAAATDFELFKHRSYDVVVINSILQYFPGPDYLSDVLAGAVQIAKDGGHIFVGDVRPLHLLELFHAAIVSAQADDDLTLCSLRERAVKGLSEEKEMVVDPRFFIQFGKASHRVSRVEMALKRGRLESEMLQFRYDVIIHVGNTMNPAPCEWINYSPERVSMAKIEKLLAQEKLERIGFTSLPNARLAEAAFWNQAFSSNVYQPETRVGEIRKDFLNADSVALDPEEIWLVAESLGYQADITWNLDNPDGAFDVLFRKGPQHSNPPNIEGTESASEAEHRPATINNPLLWKYSRQLTLKLKEYLKIEAPEFTNLGDLILLERFPKYLKG